MDATSNVSEKRRGTHGDRVKQYRCDNEEESLDECMTASTLLGKKDCMKMAMVFTAAVHVCVVVEHERNNTAW